MRLAAFITANTDKILAEFEQFARTHTTAGEEMDIAALRDHAAGILKAIALDMQEPQSDADEEEKSRGDAPVEHAAPATAAELHGSDRATSGFTLAEMFSEYRALRASVLRLWTAATPQLMDNDLDDMIRFNESVDQALAESIGRYSAGIGASREMFLAVLGHDLRSPLNAVIAGAAHLADANELSDRARSVVDAISKSGHRMAHLVDDLLDLTRTSLGQGIPITRADADLAELARDTIQEFTSLQNDREIRLNTNGHTRGSWDHARVKQALANLIGNAVQYGDATSPVTVSAQGSAKEINISVHNMGPEIPAEALDEIFVPFNRLAVHGEDPHTSGANLGLGLYIANQIAIAHGGCITVQSRSTQGTTFTMHLPR